METHLTKEVLDAHVDAWVSAFEAIRLEIAEMYCENVRADLVDPFPFPILIGCSGYDTPMISWPKHPGLLDLTQFAETGDWVVRCGFTPVWIVTAAALWAHKPNDARLAPHLFVFGRDLYGSVLEVHHEILEVGGVVSLGEPIGNPDLDNPRVKRTTAFFAAAVEANRELGGPMCDFAGYGADDPTSAPEPDTTGA
jgi:hypothetical protein